jgi:hypothetical protein
MTVTLLEGAVAIVLIVIAWQIGTLIAPDIISWFRNQFGERVEPEDDPTSQQEHTQKEHPHEPRQ